VLKYNVFVFFIVKSVLIVFIVHLYLATIVEVFSNVILIKFIFLMEKYEKVLIMPSNNNKDIIYI